jgi:hypothetical protein
MSGENHISFADEPIENPKRRLARFYARLVVVLLVLTVALELLAWNFSDLAAVITVAVVGGALVFAYGCGALMARSAAKRVDRQIEEFRRGRALALWRCSADEWRRFAEAERDRLGKDEKNVQLLMLGIFAAMGALPGGIAGKVYVEEAEAGTIDTLLAVIVGGLLGALAGVVFGFIYDWLSGWGPRSAARRRYWHALHVGGPSFIGATGVYTNGEFFGWGDVWGSLLFADFVDADPPYLQLVLGRPQASRIAPGTTDNVPEDVRIPVPAGCAEEAQEVVEILQGKSSERHHGKRGHGSHP